MSRQEHVTAGGNAESPAESESENGRRGCLGACSRENVDNTLVQLKTEDVVPCLAALDDARLAGGTDKTVTIWSLTDGKQLAMLEGHTEKVQCLAELDCNRLASGSFDKSVIIWNLADGAQLAKLEGHTEAVRCLARIGNYLVSGGIYSDGIIMWSVATGKQLGRAKRKGHVGHVLCLALLDGPRLASGSTDSSIIIWNLVEGTQLARLEGPASCLAALDGNRLASGSRGVSVIIWNLADYKQLAKLGGHRGNVYCMAALDDGRLASGSIDKSIIIWNLADGTQLAKLEGHTGIIMSLLALDGNRLASSSEDKSIIIWNVADGCFGFQGGKFTLIGHAAMAQSLSVLSDGRLASAHVDRTIRVNSLSAAASKFTVLGRCLRAFEVTDEDPHAKPIAESRRSIVLKCETTPLQCLVALVDGRLASGGDDGSIIIWSVAAGKQLAMLEGHTEAVRCLARIGNYLVSGGIYSDGIIMWSVATGKQLGRAKRKGHVGHVLCLALLDGPRLASGSTDSSIIIWNLVEGTQLARLEGHTSRVVSLVALADGRLVSGSMDESIVLWNVENQKQIFKLKGHVGGVSCMAAFNDGRLFASGGASDGYIRVRPVLQLATITACGSAFEFEEFARACHEQSRVGELFHTAAVQQHREEIDGLSASAAIIRQASVFDAIAKVTTADDENEELVEGLLALVRDDDLLPEMKRRGVSKVALEKLAPTDLFRVVIDTKYEAGAQFVLYGEIILYLALMLCFVRVAGLELLGWSKWYAGEKIIELVFAFLVLAWFSLHEFGQVMSTRKIELAKLTCPLGKYDTPKKAFVRETGVRWYALIIPRYVVLFLVCLLELPVFLYFEIRGGSSTVEVAKLEEAPRTLPEDLWYVRRWLREGQKEGWTGLHFLVRLRSSTACSIVHDPLTFLGLPRAWRGDYWNLIDVVTLVCAWTFFAWVASGRRLSVNLAVVTCILLGIKLLEFMKNANLRCATFVLMIERLVKDLRVFVVFFLYILVVFAFTFNLYLGPRRDNDNGYRSWPKSLFSLFLIAFTGEFDSDIFSTVALKVLLSIFIVVAVLVQLNVLIAIVSESYDRAETVAKSLFYRSRLELIVETTPVIKRLPRWARSTSDKDSIRKKLAAALTQAYLPDDMGRINETVRRTRAEVLVDTQRALHESEERTKEELAAVKRDLAIVAATQQTILEKLEALLKKSSSSSDE